jgi:hypothetical protein
MENQVLLNGKATFSFIISFYFNFFFVNGNFSKREKTKRENKILNHLTDPINEKFHQDSFKFI